MTEPESTLMVRSSAAAGQGAPRRISASWGVVIALVTLLVLVGVPLAYVFILWNRAAINAPTQVGNAIAHFAAEAVRPQVTINEIVFGSVQDLHREAKLVVLKATIDADVTREEGSSSWGMYWGTNVARVAVKGAKVQYTIDLQNMGTSDYQYDDSTKTMTVLLPHPHVDTEMVSIDPAGIQTLDLRGGWMRWNKYDTRDHAISELKPKIIIEANKPFLRKEADASGKEAMTKLLSPLVENLGKQGVGVQVKYRDE